MVAKGRGTEVKATLARRRPDPTWRRDLDAVRSALEIETHE
jgi:hypothetical protein